MGFEQDEVTSYGLLHFEKNLGVNDDIFFSALNSNGLRFLPEKPPL